jgi:phospholipid transport system substrate-binding protein
MKIIAMGCCESTMQACFSMKQSITVVLLGRLILMMSILIPTAVHPGEPTDQIRATVDKVLATLNDPTLAAPGAKDQRRSQLRRLIYPRFDFAEMARRSLGSTWQRVTPAEQEEFVKLFTQLLEESYVSTIESYRDETILYGRETREENFAEVATRIISKTGEQITVDYRLRRINGDWKVYDVVVENVSLVNNYRSQFNRLAAKSSFTELLSRIREKLPAPR